MNEEEENNNLDRRRRGRRCAATCQAISRRSKHLHQQCKTCALKNKTLCYFHEKYDPRFIKTNAAEEPQNIIDIISQVERVDRFASGRAITYCLRLIKDACRQIQIPIYSSLDLVRVDPFKPDTNPFIVLLKTRYRILDDNCHIIYDKTNNSNRHAYFVITNIMSKKEDQLDPVGVEAGKLTLQVIPCFIGYSTCCAINLAERRLKINMAEFFRDLEFFKIFNCPIGHEYYKYTMELEVLPIFKCAHFLENEKNALISLAVCKTLSIWPKRRRRDLMALKNSIKYWYWDEDTIENCKVHLKRNKFIFTMDDLRDVIPQYLKREIDRYVFDSIVMIFDYQQGRITPTRSTEDAVQFYGRVENATMPPDFVDDRCADNQNESFNLIDENTFQGILQTTEQQDVVQDVQQDVVQDVQQDVVQDVQQQQPNVNFAQNDDVHNINDDEQSSEDDIYYDDQSNDTIYDDNITTTEIAARRMKKNRMNTY